MAVVVEGNNARLTGKDLAQYLIKRFPDTYGNMSVKEVIKKLKEEKKLNTGGLATKNYANPVTIIDNRKKK